MFVKITSYFQRNDLLFTEERPVFKRNYCLQNNFLYLKELTVYMKNLSFFKIYKRTRELTGSQFIVTHCLLPLWSPYFSSKNHVLEISKNIFLISLRPPYLDIKNVLLQSLCDIDFRK